MPGAMVVVNAIHTALQHGSLTSPPKHMKLMAAAGLVVLVSLFFHFLPLGWATLVSFVVVGFCTATLSYMWLQLGIWIDGTIPMLGIMLHRWVSAIEHKFEHS